MAGRPRKVVSLSTGKIGKEKREAREKQEKKLRLGRDQLSPPEWLDEEAKEEFCRVVEEAGSIDHLDNLDLGVLAIYCNAYSSYIQVTEELKHTGFTETRVNRYGEYEAAHANIQIQEKYVKQIMQCSAKLGLATTDRLKLIVPVKEESETNKFLKYVK